MIARFQKFTTVALFAIAAIWAVFFVRTGEPVWAAIGALLILTAYASFLAMQFLAMAMNHGDDPTPRAALAQVITAWIGEVLTAPRVFCWRQPFRSRAIPDAVPASTDGGRRGVVLVHGFFCNRGMWNPWMTRLSAAEIPFIAVNLEPIFSTLDRYPARVEEAVARLESATGLPPVLVGHSMGGLVVRDWFERFSDGRRAHRVITIGTPHHGTWLARYGHTLNGIEMRQASPWLRALAARERAAAHGHERFTCFHGHCDNIVFPASTGTLAGADNQHIPGTAHVKMAFHPRVFAEVLRWLDVAEPSTRTADSQASVASGQRTASPRDRR